MSWVPSSYGKKNKREKKKEKKRVEEISQDERKKIREEEIRKIMKEMKREKHASYSSHNSGKSLSEELRDYYEERHRSYLRPHSHRRDLEIWGPSWDLCATFPSWTTPEVGKTQKVIFLWVPSEWKTCDEKEVWDLSRPTMSLAPVTKPFKRSILQEQFIKVFIKLEDKMCELNYKGPKSKLD